MDNVSHIVYVKSSSFKSSNNVNIAREIEKINRTFTEREENYILVGPGDGGRVTLHWEFRLNGRIYHQPVSL